MYPLLLWLAAQPRRRCGATSLLQVLALALAMSFVVVLMGFGQPAPVATGITLVLVAGTLGWTVGIE